MNQNELRDGGATLLAEGLAMNRSLQQLWCELLPPLRLPAISAAAHVASAGWGTARLGIAAFEHWERRSQPTPLSNVSGGRSCALRAPLASAVTSCWLSHCDAA